MSSVAFCFQTRAPASEGPCTGARDAVKVPPLHVNGMLTLSSASCCPASFSVTIIVIFVFLHDMNLPSVNLGFHCFYLFIYLFCFPSSTFFFFVQSSHETLNVVEEKKRAEVGKDERVTTEEMNGKEMSAGSGPGETRKVEPVTQKDSTPLSSESSSSSSESEEEDVGEYQPHHRVTEGTIREEQEEYGEMEEEPGQAVKVVEREAAMPEAIPDRQAEASILPVETEAQEAVVALKLPGEKSVHGGTVKQDIREETKEEHHTINGEVPPVDTDVLPEIICCSEVNGSLKHELNSNAFSGGNACLSSPFP